MQDLPMDAEPAQVFPIRSATMLFVGIFIVLLGVPLILSTLFIPVKTNNPYGYYFIVWCCGGGLVVAAIRLILQYANEKIIVYPDHFERINCLGKLSASFPISELREFNRLNVNDPSQVPNFELVWKEETWKVPSSMRDFGKLYDAIEKILADRNTIK